MTGLSFVTLLAYDYRYAYRVIRSYYDIADEIILGLDVDRLTWSKRPFEIDLAEVQGKLSRIDVSGKVRIVEGDFHALPTPMANETAERSALSLHCAPGNWVVQIDADETLLNAAEFRRWLLETDPGLDAAALWISVFKTFGNDMALAIEPAAEVMQVATKRRGQYVKARQTSLDYVLSPLRLLHFSWGRRPEEVRQKLRNWGHAGDFDAETFYRMWESVTPENYHLLRDFHPINGPLWPGLKLLKRGET